MIEKQTPENPPNLDFFDKLLEKLEKYIKDNNIQADQDGKITFTLQQEHFEIEANPDYDLVQILSTLHYYKKYVRIAHFLEMTKIELNEADRSLSVTLDKDYLSF